MEKLSWDIVAEVYGRGESELIKSLLTANGIEVELFQEAAGSNYAYPMSIGELARVQIFVPKSKLILAKEILESSKIISNPPDPQK